MDIIRERLAYWKREVQKDMMRGVPYNPEKYTELEALLTEIERTEDDKCKTKLTLTRSAGKSLGKSNGNSDK